MFLFKKISGLITKINILKKIIKVNFTNKNKRRLFCEILSNNIYKNKYFIKYVMIDWDRKQLTGSYILTYK